MTIISLYVNSRDRDVIESKSSTDFTIKLRKTLRNVNQINITNVCIPDTIYTINSNNNTLNYTYGVTNVAAFIHSVKLDVGNYTADELASALEVQLNAQTSSNIVANTVWHVSYIAKTNKFNIVGNIGELNPGDTTGVDGQRVRFILTETELSNILGIGDGTQNEYIDLVEDIDTSSGPVPLVITIGKQSDLKPLKALYITSKTLTDSINTSYVSSLKKKVEITDENNLIEFITKDSLGNEYPDSRTITKGIYSYETLAYIISISTTGSPSYPNSPTNPSNNYRVYLLTTFENNILTIRPYYSSYTISFLKTSTITSTIGFDSLSEDFVPSLSGNTLDLSVVNNTVAKINEHSIDGIIRSNISTIEAREYKPGLSFDSIDIQLRNEYDRIIDNGNVDWTFTIFATIN